MRDTKEEILTAALRLFSSRGYEGVSVRDIAAELGLTQGALYKHYRNKRDIINCIVERMKTEDAERARQFGLPETKPPEAGDAYRRAELDKLKEYALSQFHYWTEDTFASRFRKMLAIEQYRDGEMAQFRVGMSAGAVEYVADVLRGHGAEEDAAEREALEFYGPIYMLMEIYDGASDKEKVTRLAAECARGYRFEQEM